MLLYAGDRWSSVPASAVSIPSSTLSLAGDMIATGRHAIVDFELHIDDVRNDWLNPSIV